MEQLSGAEHFICDGTDAGIAVEDYWKWAYSDLLSNTSRGAMAEFIVRSALGITDKGGKRKVQHIVSGQDQQVIINS